MEACKTLINVPGTLINLYQHPSAQSVSAIVIVFMCLTFHCAMLILLAGVLARMCHCHIKA